MTIFANNCWHLPQIISRGDLDYYLTKPVSSLFFLNLREFAANYFLNSLIAIGLVIWVVSYSPLNFTLTQFIIYTLMVILGLLIYHAIHLLFLLTSFWTQSPRGLGDFFFTLSHLTERPISMFRGKVRLFLLYFLPFAFCTSIPASVLIDGIQPLWIVKAFVILSGLYCFVSFIWRLGLRNYSSASS
jgi:ABC-2 type transport system permease protein